MADHYSQHPAQNTYQEYEGDLNELTDEEIIVRWKHVYQHNYWDSLEDILLNTEPSKNYSLEIEYTMIISSNFTPFFKLSQTS